MVFAPFVVSTFVALTIALACCRGTRKTSILSLTLGASIVLLLWLTTGDGIGEFKTIVAVMLASYGTIVGCLILIAAAFVEYNQFPKLKQAQFGSAQSDKIDDPTNP